MAVRAAEQAEARADETRRRAQIEQAYHDFVLAVDDCIGAYDDTVTLMTATVDEDYDDILANLRLDLSTTRDRVQHAYLTLQLFAPKETAAKALEFKAECLNLTYANAQVADIRRFLEGLQDGRNGDALEPLRLGLVEKADEVIALFQKDLKK